MRRTWTSHFEGLEGVAMTTTTTTQHEAVKVEEKKEEPTAVEKARLKAVAEEEKRKKEAEELAAKETVKGKILRLAGELRAGKLFGVDQKRAWGELEESVRRLKSEQLVGELTEAEEKEKKEREKVAKAAG